MSLSDDIQQCDFSAKLPSAGTVIGERFELRRLLGQGGMSAVFLAHDQRLERDVAFKLLNPELALFREVMARFVNEARMLARIDCPHVVRLLDAGITRESGATPLPYMVLELLHGDTLRAQCASRVEPKRVIAWMLQVCEGLAAAHSEGLIHRDLKPENLFLSRQPDGTQMIKVLDFGVARSLGAQQPVTHNGEGLGSPGYMSPEQLRDASAVDERSDIWSLGVVMYELLAGFPPFEAGSTFEVCARILMGGHPRLIEVQPDVPRGLAAIVHRCLALDPASRFASVVELGEALAELAPVTGAGAVRRIRRRMSGAASLGQAPSSQAPSSLAPSSQSPSSRPAVDAHAATVPDLDGRAARLLASSRRRRGRVAARVSIAAALAVLGFAVASQAQSSRRFTEAQATLSRWGDRMGTAAQDLLQH